MTNQVTIAASANLPTRFGSFRIVAFQGAADGKDHVAIIRGDVDGRNRVPVRIHSECLTGDAFGSLRCDCRQQLETALEALGRLDQGVVLYLRQEGRGIGLVNKIRAYQLQEQGLDTVEANEALGFRPDERDYGVAAHMLAALGVGSVELMSNNPAKLRDLRKHGVQVDGRIPIVMPANPHNAAYLETKRIKSGHLLSHPPREAASWFLDVVPWSEALPTLHAKAAR